MNPKYSQGIRKYPISPVPAPVLGEIGVAMLEGSLKYGYYNFRKTDISATTYYDAVNRHMSAWWEGEDIDPDSGLSHVVKAAASLILLRDAMINYRLEDDRPPPTTAGWIEHLNKLTRQLHEKHGDD